MIFSFKITRFLLLLLVIAFEIDANVVMPRIVFALRESHVTTDLVVDTYFRRFSRQPQHSLLPMGSRTAGSRGQSHRFGRRRQARGEDAVEPTGKAMKRAFPNGGRPIE